jgi:hypothetical protein
MVANRNWATVLWPYYEGGGSACCLAMFAFACTKIMRVVTSNRLNKTVMLAFFLLYITCVFGPRAYAKFI